MGCCLFRLRDGNIASDHDSICKLAGSICPLRNVGLIKEISMTPETIFSIADGGVLICWILLIIAPRWRGTELAVHSIAIPFILGAVYVWLLWRVLVGGDLPGAGYSTLSGLARWYSSPVGVEIMWVHYLIFDLFIGAWQARDATSRGLSHWVLVPCLIATMIAGPLGLLLYLAMRLALRRGGYLLAKA
jgi:hypothetical protein